MHKDFRKLIREAQRQGFRTVRTGKHLFIEAPNGSRYPFPLGPKRLAGDPQRHCMAVAPRAEVAAQAVGATVTHMAQGTEYSVDVVARLDGFAGLPVDEQADAGEKLLGSLAKMDRRVTGAIAFVEVGHLGARFNLQAEDAYQPCVTG